MNNNHKAIADDTRTSKGIRIHGKQKIWKVQDFLEHSCEFGKFCKPQLLFEFGKFYKSQDLSKFGKIYDFL